MPIKAKSMTVSEAWQLIICLVLACITLQLATLALLRHGRRASLPWVGLSILLVILGFVQL